MTYPLNEQPHPVNRRRLVVVLVGLAAVAAAALVVALVFVPKAADRIDSGVQACKYISEGRGPDGQPTPTATPEEFGEDRTWTPEEYRQIREVFAGSRHEDIQTAGTRFVDDANAMNIFGIMGSYAALSGACANHGYVLPALTGN